MNLRGHSRDSPDILYMTFGQCSDESKEYLISDVLQLAEVVSSRRGSRNAHALEPHSLDSSYCSRGHGLGMRRSEIAKV